MLEIFKAGEFTDMNGKAWSFTDEDVQATKNAYDPAVFRAPLVVGHPKTNDPAFGWVSGLTVNDNKKLLSETEQVLPEFASLVNDGRYPKISASFFHPSHKENPVPGVWYLRHVGFLGAAAPAVKGLATASFSDDAANIVTIEFTDNAVSFAAPKPQKPEDAIVPKDKDETVDFAERESALQKREAQIAAREKNIADKAASDRANEIAAFAEKMVTENRLLPAEKDNVVSFMASFDDSVTVSFAEGDATTKATPLEYFKRFVAALPDRVDFAERSKSEEGHVSTVSFAAPAGYAVDADRLALHNKAVAYQTKNKCDYDTALTAIGA